MGGRQRGINLYLETKLNIYFFLFNRLTHHETAWIAPVLSMLLQRVELQQPPQSSKKKRPTHPPAGSLQNDKHQVGSTALAAVGPSGTLKTNDNVLGALCRIMKMYPCALLEFERHQHFKSVDPSCRTASSLLPPFPPRRQMGAEETGSINLWARADTRWERRAMNDSFISAWAQSRAGLRRRWGLSKTGSSGAALQSSQRG